MSNTSTTAISTASDTLSPTAERNVSLETPATPKQSAAVPDTDRSNPTTPTRHSFAGLAGQRPLPDEPLTSVHSPDKTNEIGSNNDAVGDNTAHGHSHNHNQDHHHHHHHDAPDDPATPTKSQPSADSDVEMADGDGDTTIDDDASDNESITSESQRPSKKKKGQRFFCTDFPPCQLSFTRSEHLARHIRKHTGERPFQCHCSRRFSRLDNLRQHAQTVHVNEEIPGDSLAATSTRFQRQIRTDRVRTPSNRTRANTISSQGVHSRGHSRNLSTSSITSNASSILIPDDPRRPLAMAGERDSYNNNPPTMLGEPGPAVYTSAYNRPPSGYTTPTSQPFSAGPTSPGYTSTNFASPTSSLSRSSFYNGARHSRRLSVPSAGGPFQSLAAATYPSPGYYSPTSSQPSTNWSQNTSVIASPTSSVFSHSRRDSETDQEYRRRTWHPGTHSTFSQRPATSGLSYHQTPDEPRPAISHQPAASQVTRLPGIESFDHAPPVPTRQQPSPMILDTTPRPPSAGRLLDLSLQHGLTKLDITASNNNTNQQPSSSVEHHWQQQQQQQPAYFNPPSAATNPPPVHRLHHMSMPEPSPTPRKNKRQAWYGGPIGPSQPAQPAFMPAHLAYRPSPEESGSSDGMPTSHNPPSQDYRPTVIGPSEPHASHPPTIEEQQRHQHHHHHHQQQQQQPHHQYQPQPPSQKVYQPPAHPVAHAYPPQTQYHYPHDDPTKPTMPHRADSGFQTGAALPPHHTLDQHTYALQAGHDPRSANAYPHTRPDQHPNDMGRLEALVAVATSENRAVEHHH